AALVAPGAAGERAVAHARLMGGQQAPELGVGGAANGLHRHLVAFLEAEPRAWVAGREHVLAGRRFRQRVRLDEARTQALGLPEQAELGPEALRVDQLVQPLARLGVVGP